MSNLAFDQPDPNARHARPVPPAVIEQLGEAIELHDSVADAARRRINDAVDLSQLVAGMDFERRATRQWTRVCAFADAAGLLLDLDRFDLIQLADPKRREPA